MIDISQRFSAFRQTNSPLCQWFNGDQQSQDDHRLLKGGVGAVVERDDVANIKSELGIVGDILFFYFLVNIGAVSRWGIIGPELNTVWPLRRSGKHVRSVGLILQLWILNQKASWRQKSRQSQTEKEQKRENKATFVNNVGTHEHSEHGRKPVGNKITTPPSEKNSKQIYKKQKNKKKL